MIVYSFPYSISYINQNSGLQYLKPLFSKLLNNMEWQTLKLEDRSGLIA